MQEIYFVSEIISLHPIESSLAFLKIAR